MAEAGKNSNYDPQTTEKLLELYSELGTEGIHKIAVTLDKTERSIRSKLVREGVYIPKDKTSGRKLEGPSKKELLRDIEAKGFNVNGFESATKPALERLLNLVQH